MVELQKVSRHQAPEEIQGGLREKVSPARRHDVLLAWALRLIAAGPVVVLLCIWGVFSVLSPYFATVSNLTNVLVQSSSIALLALGALLVVLVGSLDLSLGSTVGFCTIVAAVVFRDAPSLDGLVVLLVLLVGAALGVVNAVLIVGLRLGNAFIVTLGMLYIVQSLAYVVSGGTQVPGVSPALTTLANGSVLGVPGPVLLVLGAATALWFLLHRLAWGRWIVAIGGNRDAAVKVGIPVRAVLCSVYVIASVLAAVTGILVSGLNSSGAVDNGTSILQAIAAVVVGGASLSGGRGNVGATVVGALILGSVTNGLTLLSISTSWTPFAIGAVLVAAVGLDRLRSSVEGRLRVRQAQAQAGAL